MTFLERFIALRRSRFFDVMSDAELATLAEIVRESNFAPSATVCDGGRVLEKVYVVTAGDVVRESGTSVPRCFGAASLLFGLPVRERLIASSEEGAQCLVIRRPHFLTILRQFPCFLTPLISISVDVVEVETKGRAL